MSPPAEPGVYHKGIIWNLERIEGLSDLFSYLRINKE